MQLINPSYEILEFKDDELGIYEAIELAGRTCYRSEGNIQLDENGRSTTAKSFVDKMVKSGHGAMLEHGTVYLTIPPTKWEQITTISKYVLNPYSETNETKDMAYITTNYRVLVENDWLDDLEYLSPKTDNHIKRYTVRFITDRGVTHELVRHRKFSLAHESTRYCNYSRDRFGRELTFILPPWFSDKDVRSYTDEDLLPMLDIEEQLKTENRSWCLFLSSCLSSEQIYMALITDGQTPQQARQALTNTIKSEIVVTGFSNDWQHFFNLRSVGVTGAPHPSIKQLADPLYEEFKARKFV